MKKIFLVIISLFLTLGLSGCAVDQFITPDNSAVNPPAQKNQPTDDRTEQFKDYFSQKFNWEKDLITINIYTETSGFLRGGVKYVKDWLIAQAPFYAVKKENSWQIIYDHTVMPLCTELDKYDFPEELKKGCGVIMPLD